MTRGVVVIGALLAACTSSPETSGDAGPIDVPDYVAPCAEELAYFETQVWQPTLSVLCIGCHNEAGPAKDSRMVLWPPERAGYLEHNFQQAFNVATVGTQREPLLLLMPSNTNPERQHPGGELFKPDSVTYAALRGFADRAWTEGCDGDAQPIDCTDPQPGPRTLRRLTAIEYDNTIQDLFGMPSTWGSTFPADTVVDGFRNNAKTLIVTPLLADKVAVAAETIADEVSLEALLSCPLDNGTPACARAMIERLGERVFRRPLSSADVDRYAALHAAGEDFEAGCRLVISAMLQSPHFLYRSELGNVQSDGSYQLSDWEIATELAYTIWQSMPDEMLFAAARAGELHSAPQIETQVTRMLASPRARSMVRNFVIEWLGLNAVTTVPRDTQAFPDLTQAIRDALLAEVERVIDHVAFDQAGTLADLLTTPTTFLDPTLAQFYGVDVSAVAPGSDGTHEVTLVSQDRSGLLTIGAAMLTHARSNASSPVHRGRFVRERLLCQVPPPPPPGLNVQPPAVDPTLTARERYAAHSVMEPCRSCHQLMDPIGFSFEHFDGIGRYRADDNGLPIDVSGEILRSARSDATFEGTSELSTLLANSDDVKDCFARQAFRFGYGLSDSNDLRCAVDAVRDQMADDAFSITGFVRALTRGVHFSKRRATDPDMMPAPLADAGMVEPMVDAGMPQVDAAMPTPPLDDLTRERIQNDDWGAGYCHTYRLTNQSDAPITWSVTLPIDGTISNAWESNRSGDSGNVTFIGVSHNATINAGGTAQFGFCAVR